MPYKLTERGGQTYGGMQWGPGVTHKARGSAKRLCTDGWIHYYECKSRYLPVLLNHIDGFFMKPETWRFEPSEGTTIRRQRHKAGCKQGTTVRRVPTPRFSNNQRVAFAIFLGQAEDDDPEWNKWADDWLTNRDRSRQATCSLLFRVQSFDTQSAHLWALRAACTQTEEHGRNLAAPAAAYAASYAKGGKSKIARLEKAAERAYRWKDPAESARGD